MPGTLIDDGARWPAGHHLVITRSGVVMAGGDPVATASPSLTVEGPRDGGRPMGEDDLRSLATLTSDPGASDWSDRWRPDRRPGPVAVGVPSEPVVARLPLVLGPGDGGFVAATPGGPVTLSVAHVLMLTAFQRPIRAVEAIAAGRAASGGTGADAAAALIGELVGAALLVEPSLVAGSFDAGTRARQRSRLRQLRARRSIQGIESLASSTGRVPVVGLVTSLSDFPLSLGMVLANAEASERLGDRYSFHLVYATPEELAAVTRPGIWLLSNYLWTERRNVRLAQALRSSPARHLTVFGGPQVPGPAEVGDWLDAAAADVAVHGEGEGALEELLFSLPDGEAPDLAPLAARSPMIAGCTVNGPDGPRGGADRERVADLDGLPSPFLDGWFDQLGGDLFFSAVLETNRGCPYGCTFCDWGSATRSRIRSFGLDRVKAEIEWIAAHDFEHLLLADANFGILERDRDIATHLVAARERHGAPRVLGTNYAKNPKRHVVDIVADLAAGGFITMGQVALQTTDKDTLSAVNRSNIAPENYDDLLRAFDEMGLPIQTDLMMGLPGATPAAFRADLQHVADSDVHAIVARTKVLRNSPMNAPEYKKRFHLRTAGDEFISATNSFDEDDMEAMILEHARFFAADDLGVLRVLLRFARHRTGTTELELLDRLHAVTDAEVTRAPTTWWVLRSLARWAVEPCDWTRLRDEVRELATSELGLADDDALATVLAVQHALLPAYGRRFPHEIDLDHDVIGWWADLKEVRRSGGHWSSVVDLGDRAPGRLVVEDPDDICSLAMGDLALMGRSPAWDLRSAVSRPSPGGLLVTAG